MIKELEQAISSIEQDIFESTGGVEYLNITVKSNGFCQIVEFVGIRLWNSEDDMRDEVNDNGDKEPIEDYLRKALKAELIKLASINV